MVTTGTGNLSQLLVNENQRWSIAPRRTGLDIANLGGRLPVGSTTTTTTGWMWW